MTPWFVDRWRMIGPALLPGVEDADEGTGSAHNITITDLHLHGNTNHTRYPCYYDNTTNRPLCEHVRDNRFLMCSPRNVFVEG